MPARLFPLANYVDLSSSRGIIALVWLIRQQGKITYPALYKAVFGQSLNQASDGFKTPTVNLQQILAFYQVLAQLLRNGIIETTPDIPVETVIAMFQHYDPNNPDHKVVLQVADRVRFIQQLFDVSLTEITHKGVPVKSHPLFGDPIDDFDHTWTDIFVIMPTVRNLMMSIKKPSNQPSKMRGTLSGAGMTFSPISALWMRCGRRFITANSVSWNAAITIRMSFMSLGLLICWGDPPS